MTASLLLTVILVALAVFIVGESPPSAQAQQPATDTTPPSISSIAITSDPDDVLPFPETSVWTPGTTIYIRAQQGLYAVGDAIQVTVTFDEPVTVAGTPQLGLTIGNSVKTANYKSVDQGAAVFEYLVAEGDEDKDGIAVAANALALNGGTIRDTSANDADRSHDALTTQRGHRVDGIPPRLLEVSQDRWGNDCDDGPFDEGVYNIGDTMNIALKFSERVYTNTIHDERRRALPQVRVRVGGADRLATGSSNGWPASYSYTIRDGDLDSDGPSVPADAIVLNGATIRDAAGNHALLNHSPAGDDDDNFNCPVDGVRPVVERLAITSDPGDDDTYGVGDKVEVTVTFSENVSVPQVSVGGVTAPQINHPRGDYLYPQLQLDIGGKAKTATYWSYAGSQVIFTYTVQAGDSDDNGIAIGANKLALKGWIEDDAGNSPVSGITDWWDGASDAVVTHQAVPDQANHKVVGAASPLTLTGHTGLSYDEGGELTWPEYNRPYYSVSGTEADVTWSLSGDDGHLFRLKIWEVGDGGTLEFASPPNYEDRADADQDNQYEVTVGVSDGTNTATLQVTVLLQNIPFDDDEVPAIVGTAHVGKTLTVDTSRMSISHVTLGPFYWWIRSDGTTDTEIPGARYDSYTLTNDDLGKTIKVRMNMYYYPRWGSGEFASRTSEPTATVASAPPGAKVNMPATGAPTISGTLQVGQTLTAGVSSIADADGMTNVSYSYRWVRDDGAGDTNLGRISQEPTYTLSQWDRGHTFKVWVSFIDDAGHREILTSSATGPIEPLANNPPTGQPAISGVARVGETLTVDTSGITDPDGLFGISWNRKLVELSCDDNWQPCTYQWISNDGTTDADIVGATGNTYTLATTDAGHTVKVRVSFTDAAGYEEALTSAPTSAVAAIPPGAPTSLAVSPTETAGELAASWAAPASDGGAVITGYKVQWKEAVASWDTPADVFEVIVAGTADVITGLSGGVKHTVRIIAVNSAGDSLPSNEVERTPAEEPPEETTVPGPVVSLELSATADSVTASWQAPVSGDAADKYIAHLKPQGGAAGSGKTKTIGSKKTAVTFRNLEAGTTYTVWVRAQNQGGKGERVHATVTLPEVPGPVLNLEWSTTADSITLTWAPPESGPAPDSYIAHLKLQGGKKGAIKRPKAKKTTVTFKNLEAGQTYEVWVRAKSEGGKGERTHATITVPE